MATKQRVECPACGHTWVKKTRATGGVRRVGYSKLNEDARRCHNCKFVESI
ncbi:hypothetical protein HSB1_38180 [Halogranum salarium B-1]|uniref:50S ribosomal protein L33 n=1 Tax=Halogranum salarium B-1 TaxID=1210908 RepID=J3JEI7_9EURY|nr:hypothetical protein HSB1_38180 [Halogranum salarium B-1]